jgi:hypothetical protein
MTRFPTRLADRAAATIAQTARLVNTAHQRLNTIGSQVASLTPGSWSQLTLQNGWGNVAGYIPAQVRIQQSGLAYIVGHISGGTVANGTVIAALPAGYYNTAHQHAFNVNAISGAQASQAGYVTNPDISQAFLPYIPLNNHTFTVSVSGSSGTLQMGPSSGQQIGSIGLHDSSGNPQVISAPATTANNNTPTLTVSTAGQLTITNLDPNVTEISFSEHLPLVTS